MLRDEVKLLAIESRDELHVDRSHSRARLRAMKSNTGCNSLGERLMT